MSINQIYVTGRLTQDPTIKHTPSGKQVAELNIAVNDGYKKGDEWIDRAYFFRASAWGKLTEKVTQYDLRKGQEVLINGRLSFSTWTDKEGVEHENKEILISTFEVIASKPKKGIGTSNEKLDLNKKYEVHSEPQYQEDEIPF